MADQTLAPAVLDALRTVWSADVTLAAQVAAGTLTINDGPPVTDRSSPTELWVGASGASADEEVISGQLSLADFEADLDEMIDITCAIWVATGDTTMATARTSALAIFDAAAAAVRGSALGVAGLHPVTHVSEYTLRQGQFASGAAVVLTFVVHAEGMV